jgi:demethylmenaquinone methyltransferase/2-methoxy-6-polyprenyl-1,4-benzoquinol methylase
VTNAFVLRNLADLKLGLAEMARVVKPGGRVVCLDMTHPRPGLFAALYRLYFNHVLPPISGAISGNPRAYRYLPNSLRNYPDAGTLARMLEVAGLTDVRVKRLAGGAVALHTGRKPSAAATR